jgi:hypothetical protein
MLKKLVVLCGLVAVTYLLLSMRVDGKPLFARLYQWTSPLTDRAQSVVTGVAGAGLRGSRMVGQKLFHNSVPTAAPVARAAARKLDAVAAPLEDIPTQDRKALDELIQNYAR